MSIRNITMALRSINEYCGEKIEKCKLTGHESYKEYTALIKQGNAITG